MKRDEKLHELILPGNAQVFQSTSLYARTDGYLARWLVGIGDHVKKKMLERFRRQSIDIVLLDLNMPVKGGWDTFERLTINNPLLPIIVITARSDAQSIATAAGVALMQKPLDIPLLLRAMRDLLAEPAFGQ